jgi:hypothetical protein
MYALGTAPGEVDRCLSDTKKRLVAAGAKADNLPVGLERQVRFLAGLQPKQDAIVRNWFKKNAVFEDIGDTATALESIQAARAGDVAADSTKTAWRVLLRSYAQGENEPIVQAFLAGVDAHPVQEAPNSVDHRAPALVEITDEDAASCLDIVKGKPLSAPLRPLPALLWGVLASMRGDERTAAERRDELGASNSPVEQKLGLVIAAMQSRPAGFAAGTVQKLQPYVAGMVDSADGIPFIGIVKKVLPQGHIFVSPVALEIAGKWTEVSPMHARALFPSSGDATAAPHSIPGSFAEGEIGIWTAELKSPDKATRYVITQHKSRAYSVNRLPYSSKEPDKVRQWLLEAYKPSHAIVPIFLLTDGVAIRLPSGLSDPGKFNFDMPLDCYRGLESIELRASGLILVPDLPAGIGKYHCEPAGTLIKRLFKQAKDFENVPSFGKVQIQALASFANSSSSAVDLQAHERALQSLGNASDAKVFLDGAIQQILELPEIKDRIDTEIACIAKGYEEQQASLKKEVADLAGKRRLLEADLAARKEAALAELDRLKKTGRQQEADLELRIRNTFDKAVEGGIETLANAALLKAILGSKAASPQTRDAKSGPEIFAVQISADFNAAFSVSGKALPNKRALVAAITARAEQSGLSETMILAAVALASVRPVIGFSGQTARDAIAVLAALISEGVLCEVAVCGDMFSISDLMNAPALIRSGRRAWPATLGAFLEVQASAGRASVIELRGANRTPPECLLPELAELPGAGDGGRDVCWKDAANNLRHVSVRSPTVFALTFAEGKSVFPVQGTLAALMPILHSDGPWGDETGPSAGSPIDATSVSVEAWNALAGPVQIGSGTQSAVRKRVRFAAEALGFSEPRARAIPALAFSVGRHAPADLRNEVERLAPDLSPYAAEITDSAAAGAIRRIFESN